MTRVPERGTAPGSPPGRSPVTVDDLQIAGFVPLSTVDWPGKLVATVFCQGCPWDCGYCQNASLIDPRTAGIVGWSDDVEPLLTRRSGLLDGVVFTGGEATRQAAIRPAMVRVRELGYRVGLHTGGPYPRRLTEILPLVDWVGLDIKAMPEDYDTVTRTPRSGVRAWESLRAVLKSGVDHEVRLTVHPGGPQTGTAVHIAETLHTMGVRAFALQSARPDGTREPFQRAAATWQKGVWEAQFADMASKVARVGFDSFTAR